jgi:S-DNA-T family DNA segregation ATPase FtsK/SpoIIIE
MAAQGRTATVKAATARKAAPGTGAGSGTPFLPPEARAALLRTARRLGGAALVGVAGLTAMAWATYTPSDPSLNTAAGQTAANLLGAPGAVLADATLQAVGLAVAAPLAVLVAWGLRLLGGGSVGWAWPRVLGLILGTLLLAVGLSPLGRPEGIPLPTGVGGFSGQLLLAHLQAAGRAFGLPGELRFLAALIAAPLAMALLLWTSAIRAGEWRAVFRGIGAVARRTTGGVARGAGGLRAAAATLPRRAEAAVVRTDPSFDRAAATPVAEAAEAREAPLPPASPPPAAAPAPRPPRAIVDAPAPRAASQRDLAARQGSLLPEDADGGLRLPPLDLLGLPHQRQGATQVTEDALAQNARLLEGVLADFGVNGQIVKVRPGPVVTLYELDPAPGTKTARVVGLADDIARSMSAVSVRIAVVPGQSTIGIELPNGRRETVNFRELLAADAFHKADPRHNGLTLALGRDIGGGPVYVDLARMPHLLIAGTTGSGKSVAVNTMICSLLYRMTPDDCRFIMIDPKMLELSVYDGIPHLLTPVVTDPGKAVVALKWAVKEMENRYRAMSQMGVRNIAGYNQRLRDAAAKGQAMTRTVQTGFDPETGKPIFEDQALDMTPLPFIVVIVDEMADLMLVAGKDVEAAIQRLAQMARAAGIHLIMATQRPSVDVITGTIKANFPTRISFQVTSKIDSRTILGEQGAEQLLGAGDMLYMAAGGRITRVHGPFVTDTEVEEIAGFLRDQGSPDYIDAVTDEDEQGASTILDVMTGGDGDGGSGDALFDQAVAVVARERKASTSFVQRHLQIGYNRAARIIERMEAEGMVSRANHVGKREVLLPPLQDDL